MMATMFKAVDTYTGEIVGFVELCRTAVGRRGGNSKAYISNLAVRRAHRRRGVGRMLVEACEDVVTTWGYRDILLAVDEDNLAARRLYQVSEWLMAFWRVLSCGLIVCLMHGNSHLHYLSVHLRREEEGEVVVVYRWCRASCPTSLYVHTVAYSYVCCLWLLLVVLFIYMCMIQGMGYRDLLLTQTGKRYELTTLSIRAVNVPKVYMRKSWGRRPPPLSLWAPVKRFRAYLQSKVFGMIS